MIEAIKSAFEDRVRIFVGTASLRRKGGLDEKMIRSINEGVLENVDILSCNEIELDDLHTVLVGNGAYQDIALVDKLKQLQIEAMKICHSKDGVILEIGCDPGRIVTNEGFLGNPFRYLQETLRLAADGATFAVDAEIGKRANECMVRIYSDSVMARSEQLFNQTFLKTVQRQPGGIVAVQSPLVGRRFASVTGLGAIFDALLLSFLMRE